MNATELRIGNLIYGINRRSEVHLPTSTPLKIMQIGIFNSEAIPFDKNPAEEENWLKITNSDLSPIPLTAYWLIKFGFEQGDDVEINNHFWTLKLANRPYRNISVSPESGTTYYHVTNLATIIKYVHQLQNLYYALTGEELTTP